MDSTVIALAVADALEYLANVIPNTQCEKVAESSCLDTNHVLEFLKFFTVGD